VIDRVQKVNTALLLRTCLSNGHTRHLPDDPSDADFDRFQKASTDSNPSSLSSKDTHGVHQLETPECGVHRAPWADSRTTDSMVRGPGSENNVKPFPLKDPVCIHNLPCSLSNCPLTSLVFDAVRNQTLGCIQRRDPQYRGGCGHMAC